MSHSGTMLSSGLIVSTSPPHFFNNQLIQNEVGEFTLSSCFDEFRKKFLSSANCLFGKILIDKDACGFYFLGGFEYRKRTSRKTRNTASV